MIFVRNAGKKYKNCTYSTLQKKNAEIKRVKKKLLTHLQLPDLQKNFESVV